MKPRLVHSITGFLLGFVSSMLLSALLLRWPLRTLGLVSVLGLAFLMTLRRDDKPLQGGSLFASWFTLGYGVFSALLAVLDLAFPPLT